MSGQSTAHRFSQVRVEVRLSPRFQRIENITVALCDGLSEFQHEEVRPQVSVKDAEPIRPGVQTQTIRIALDLHLSISCARVDPNDTAVDLDHQLGAEAGPLNVQFVADVGGAGHPWTARIAAAEVGSLRRAAMSATVDEDNCCHDRRRKRIEVGDLKTKLNSRGAAEIDIERLGSANYLP
jgi:hypothetical protein